MGRKNKKSSKKRSYKYAVKRPKLSKKDRGKILKASVKGGIKGRDVVKAAKKAKKKYGGYPSIPGIMPGKADQQYSSTLRRNQQAKRDRYYARLDGGTEDTMYIKGPAPGKQSRSKSKSKESRLSAPSSQSGTSSMDQQLYDFQKEREEMMAQYEQMMIEQARQAEEQRRQMEIAMRAQAANAYSAGLQPSFQLQGAGTIPKLSGIEQFKKRLGSQFGTASPYTGLAKIQSGTVNA